MDKQGLEQNTMEWQEPDWIERAAMILDSYRHWLQADLIPRAPSKEADAEALFEASCVVVAHGTQADPLLCYGNRQALTLWEIDIPSLLQTPSRLTAEPLHRDERARLLARTTQHGFVDDYQGVRISRSGRRFLIRQATVWNLLDSSGRYAGQAATFCSWDELIEPSSGGVT